MQRVMATMFFLANRTLSEYELSRIPDFNKYYILKTIRMPVKHIERYQQYPPTKSGQMMFMYYERVK
jgi:hypothetical protein